MTNIDSFKIHLVKEAEYNEYLSGLNLVIESLENGSMNESLLDSLTASVKDGITFIKQFTELVKGSLVDMLKVFKERVLFTFFSKISWSITELVSLVKKGYNLWKELHNVIAKYIADTGVIKWTSDKLKELDKFLDSHPIVKKGGSLVIVGFLIYQWTSMVSFTGDIEFDFDQTVLFEAMKGNYSLSDLFASDSGVKMLMFIATGVLTGISFPWPGESWVLFTLSIVYTIAKPKYPTVAHNIIKMVKSVKNIKN